MIRDPSDGTIKEKLEVGTEQFAKNANNSGLPISKDKPDELTRLEKSRERLKTYWAKRSLVNLIPDDPISYG
jgi:hypothetical protein